MIQMKGGGVSFVGSSSSRCPPHSHSHSHSHSQSVSTTIISHSRTRTSRRTRSTRTSSSSISAQSPSESEIEIRVCVNRSCRRQGSLETLHTLSGIAPPHVSVISCGCLGRCGAGPNLVLLPDSVFFSHCATPARALHTMSLICCAGGHADSNSDSWTNSLAALALRKRAEDEFGKGNFAQSHLLLSQAIDLKPFGGIHTMYKDRSAASLAMGNMAEALEDARDALTLAPKYPEAYICEGDAFMAMDQYDAAEKSYSVALELDPSIRRSKSFKARVAKLQQKLIAAESP